MYIKTTLTKATLDKFSNKDLTKLVNPKTKKKDYDKPIELADRDSLGVRVSLKGKVVWQFRYRYLGKAQRLTLGSYPNLDVDDARKKLPELKGCLEEGKDPKQMMAARKNKNLIKSQYTIIKLASEWLEALDKDDYKLTTIENYTSVIDKWILNAPKRDKLEKNWVIDNLNIPFDDIRGSQWMNYFEWICDEGSPIVSGSVLKLIKSMVKWGERSEKISNLAILQFCITK